jgi:lipopolysaccharide export system permease protein
LTPLLALGLLFSGLSAFLTLSVDHRVRARLNSLFHEVAARGGMIEPGRFVQLPGHLLFVESRDRGNRLEGVMIVNQVRERPMLVFAERGHFALLEDEARIRVRLENGDVHIAAPDDPERYRRIAFEIFDYSLDVRSLLESASAKERPKQMTFDELRNTLERIRAGDIERLLDETNAIEYEMEMHRRFALPAAPILFALIALPLGQRRAGSVRAWGALLCAVVVFGYYSLLSFAQFLARAGWFGAGTALWMPNLIFALIGIALLHQASRRWDG